MRILQIFLKIARAFFDFFGLQLTTVEIETIFFAYTLFGVFQNMEATDHALHADIRFAV